MNIVNSTQTIYSGSNLGGQLLVSCCTYLRKQLYIPPSPLSLTANWDFTAYILSRMCLHKIISTCIESTTVHGADVCACEQVS